MTDPTLLDLPFDVLRDRMVSLGQPTYRAQQVWQAVYRDLTSSYEEMSTLPIHLRIQMAELLPMGLPIVERSQQSSDHRTRKLLLRLADDEAIEVVSMDYDNRRTACISTQAGCAMNCRICATGRSGFRRNLSVGEIVGQVLHAARICEEDGQRLTHVVYMGMGEPFANYDATIQSIRALNDARGFGLGARSFTVSTVGIVPGIERFAEEMFQVNLAVSLHAANDELRTRLVPINETYPLATLLSACETYIARTNRRITFEIALVAGVNDSLTCAHETVERLRGLLCHVNLIPFNPIAGLPWNRSPSETVAQFSDILRKAGIPVTVRVRRGIEIEAGCGQLRARALEETHGGSHTQDA